MLNTYDSYSVKVIYLQSCLFAICTALHACRECVVISWFISADLSAVSLYLPPSRSVPGLHSFVTSVCQFLVIMRQDSQFSDEHLFIWFCIVTTELHLGETIYQKIFRPYSEYIQQVMFHLTFSSWPIKVLKMKLPGRTKKNAFIVKNFIVTSHIVP